MERSTRRPELPAFPRSRPRHPEQLVLNRVHRLRRLQVVLLALQIGSLALLILMTMRESPPLCQLQQAMQRAQPQGPAIAARQ